MTLTPELLAQMITTIGPVGTVALIMWVYGKRGAASEDDGVRELVLQMQQINARLIRVETILEERK